MPKSRKRQKAPHSGKEIRSALRTTMRCEIDSRMRIQRLETVVGNILHALIQKGLLATEPQNPAPAAQAPDPDAIGERRGLGEVEDRQPVEAAL